MERCFDTVLDPLYSSVVHKMEFTFFSGKGTTLVYTADQSPDNEQLDHDRNIEMTSAAILLWY